MSNPTTPFGLKPVRYYNGAPWNGATQRMYIHASQTTALYIGDPVKFQEELDEKDTTAHWPSIEKAAITSTGVVLGIVVAFEPRLDDLTKIYMPAYTEGWAFVCTDPQVIYHIRDDGSGTPAKVFPGGNANLADAGGSTVTGLSGFALDASTPSATQTDPLHILQLANIPNNNLADYAVWEVLVNTTPNVDGMRDGVVAT